MACLMSAPEEPTIKRETSRLDPQLVLPAPPLLAPPIYVEPPLPPGILATPVFAGDLNARLIDVVPPADRQPEDREEHPEPRVRRLWPVRELAVLAALGVAVTGIFLGLTWLAALVVLGLLAAAGLTLLANLPVAVICAMAFFLGAAPGVKTPGIGISITFVLSMAMWVALAVMPEVKHRVNWAAGLTATLIGTAFFAFLGNPVTGASFSDFFRWSVTAAAIYPLSVLPARYLALVGRWFVYGCTAAAAFGIVFVAIDRDGSKLNKLTIFGYNADGGNGRFVYGANGNIARLTSTYVDPNLGGFLMAVGLILGLALLRGRRRIISSGLLAVAIALTLGRADIGSLVVAGVLLVLFSRLGRRLRVRLLSSGLAGAIGLFAVPAVRTRLSNSFGANDQGSSARWDAFRIFPGQMSGHWLLGRGFGAPELTNATAAAATNYVANAPLLTVYRGGVVVGLAFTALMLTAGLHAWRLLRGSRFETVVVGAGYLGVMLVALQLDFPVVTLSPATLTFALLLAFVARPEATADPANEISEHALSSGDIELEAAHG
jgi:hypothetical protein